ncbi:hypothetical protein L3Q82_019486 [Scortum barcoo]|uniref:Uncharacterized protein n=1 Tax=Scortum barcoo TaxID=214431 RepID=A0ACB8VEG8_9TELE|nr:hypothetical protein L3Q82_019486 [Scortum barcoo]
MTVKCRPHYLPPTNTRRRFTWLRGISNHVNLTDTLPKFYQHVTIPTRGNNTLDRVYTNKRDAYRAVPHPHLGFSDHISIMLLPAYRPLLRHHTQRRGPSPCGPVMLSPHCRTVSSAQTFRSSGRGGPGGLYIGCPRLHQQVHRGRHQHQDSNRISEPETLAECGGPVSAESQGCCVQVW